MPLHRGGPSTTLGTALLFTLRGLTCATGARAAGGLTFIKGDPVAVPSKTGPMIIEFWASWYAQWGLPHAVLEWKASPILPECWSASACTAPRVPPHHWVPASRPLAPVVLQVWALPHGLPPSQLPASG